MLFNNTVIAKPPTTTQPRRARTATRKRIPERKRSITRERILDAAERLFLEQGFTATKVQDIALAAGYTTGAIYSNFGGKAHLFLAVLVRRGDPQVQIWRHALESASSAADAAKAMGVALRAARYEPEWYAAAFEFYSFAARHEDLRRETAEVLGSTSSMIMEILADVAKDAPLPLERLAPIIVGLMRGLAWTWVVDPDAADDTLFADAVAVLIGADQLRGQATRGPVGQESTDG